MTHNVLDVARKELTDIGRDRRALFVMLVLPIALYPLLMIGVTLAGAAQMRSLAGRRYTVLVDGKAPPRLLARLRASEAGLDVRENDGPLDALSVLERGEAGAIVVVPPRLEETIAASTTETRVAVLWHGGLDASAFARSKVERAVAAWRDEIVAERLRERALPAAFIAPVRAEAKDVGPPGAMIGRMLAVLLVVMSVSGAFYPASDLGAGEKERGTLETLLVSPASRTDLALGKLTAIFAVALAASLVNLASLGLTFTHLGSLSAHAESVTVSPGTILSILSVLAPLVLLFSAVALLVSTHAASYKEAQSYLTPVMLVAVIPPMAAGLPGLQLTPFSAVVPVLGPAILIKELLGGTSSGLHVLMVAASSTLYALVAARAVARVYEREEILFRPAAAPAIGLLSQTPNVIGGARARVPTPQHALALAITALLLVWFIGATTQLKWPVRGLVLTQILCIAAPAIAYARVLGLDVRATFRIRSASALGYVATILLAAGSVVLAFDLSHLQTRVIGGLMPDELKAFARIGEAVVSHGPFVAIAVFAALPAVCEEPLFRGFVLSGFRSGLSPVGAALASSALFALIHLDPGRLAHTAVLGMILAAIAMRTGSIVPCALFHFINNASALSVQFVFERDATLLVRLGLFATFEPDSPPAPTWLARAVAASALVAGGILLTRVRDAAETKNEKRAAEHTGAHRIYES